MFFTDDLRKKIDSHPVITFDVFDTLIFRDVYYTEDIFSIVAKKTGVRNFRKKRMAAAIRAQKNNKYYTLKDIYDFLSYPDCVKKQLYDEEINAEYANITLNSEMKAVYDYCLQTGKKIYAISDMYLSSDVISCMLKRAGYNIDTVLVSCECKAVKSDGSLFSYFLRLFSIQNKDVLHIGDNEKADGGAQGCCIDYELYSRCNWKNYYYYSPFFSSLRKTVANRLGFDYKDEYLSYLQLISFIHNRSVGSYSVAEQIGYRILGPLVLSYCNMIHEVVHEKKIQKIFFLARDAKFIMMAYEQLYGNDVEMEYFRLSKKAISPALQYINGELTEENKEQFFAFKNYLENINFCGNLAIVDVGWSGNTYCDLKKICKFSKIDLIPHLFYLGSAVSLRAKLPDSEIGGIFLNVCPVRNYVSAGFIETLFSETGGTCLKYQANTGKPILGENEENCEVLDRIHAACMSFIKDSCGMTFNCSKYIQKVFFRYVENPQKNDVRMFDNFLRRNDGALKIVCHEKPFTFNSLKNSLWKGAFFKENFGCFSVFLYRLYIIVDSFVIRRK